MRILSLVMLAGALLVYSCKLDKPKSKPVAQCTCDTSAALLVINDSSFNRIGAYDTSSFTAQNFYELEPGINRQLWYRDIENTRATKFTTLWNAYYPANYYASQIDFLNQYCDRSDIELAFQFGPNHDLWAYHSFVVKKIACCYLVTRSYYRHARFNYKAYAFLNKQLADSLFEHLQNIFRTNELDTEATIRKFRIVQKEGSREISREIDFYNLDAIIAVGYRVNSYEATRLKIEKKK